MMAACHQDMSGKGSRQLTLWLRDMKEKSNTVLDIHISQTALSPGWKQDSFTLVCWKSGEHLCIAACRGLMRCFTLLPPVNADQFPEDVLIHEVTLQREPLSTPMCAGLLPKMPQSPAAGQGLLPVSLPPPGCPFFSYMGPMGAGVGRAIPEDCWRLGFAPSPPSLFSLWHPIKEQSAWQRQKKSFWPRDNLAPCNISWRKWRKLLCCNFVSTKWIPHNYCIQCESQWKP